MDRIGVLAELLQDVAEQRCGHAVQRLETHDDLSLSFRRSLGSFLAFMQSQHARATLLARAAQDAESADPVERGLADAVFALAATSDPVVSDEPVSLRLPCPEASVRPDDRVAAFGRYVAIEAALASARLELARTLLRVGAPPQDVWADHPFSGVMLACAARVAAFTGHISEALSMLESAERRGIPGLLVSATHALAAGNAADVPRMKALVAEVEAAGVAPIDRLGGGVHLLLAFSADALGDTDGAVRHLLRAGGGAELENLSIVDRALGYELLVTAATTSDDLDSAIAWQQRAGSLAGHRIAAPSMARTESRIALSAGDPVTAEAAALRAVDAARRDDRRIEQAQGEMLLAQARIAADKMPAAARGLRETVVAGDSTGHLAVRRAATRVLRPTRRRLPPINGSGRESLSERERHVADLIADGLDNAGIAARLHLSETTVRTHVTRILTAHGVATRTGLLAQLHTVPDEPRHPCDLTHRQAEVAALIAQGRRNTEIAADLGISAKSVEAHIGCIRDRWQASTRFDVALRWWSLQRS